MNLQKAMQAVETLAKNSLDEERDAMLAPAREAYSRYRAIEHGQDGDLEAHAQTIFFTLKAFATQRFEAEARPLTNFDDWQRIDFAEFCWSCAIDGRLGANITAKQSTSGLVSFYTFPWCVSQAFKEED